MHKVAGLLVVLMVINCSLLQKSKKENIEVDGITYLAEEEEGVKTPKSNPKKVEPDSKNKKQSEKPEDVRDFKKLQGITYLNDDDQSDEIPNKPFKPSQKVEMGKASYYALEFKGRRTANGEIYDPTKLTAAHPTLPFGTTVRVTNISNQESVVVRINDRGPHVKSRIIDLSYAAAEKLGLIKSGIGQVAVEVIVNPK